MKSGNVFRRGFVLFWLLVLLPGVSTAEVLLLIPGYLGGAGDWRNSGVTAALTAAGWHDGGHLPALTPANSPSGGKTLYTLSLPSAAPIPVQAHTLGGIVAAVQERHPDESVWLAGHSAGGVVGRYFMVEHPEAGVGALITVASPHRGTEGAEWGLMLGQSPLAWFAPLFGAEELNISQGLFSELQPERPGTFLFWLNRRPHPAAVYVSVVRGGGSMPWGGDTVVPAASQDLNRVLSLHGRAWTVVAGNTHSLVPADGALLAGILDRLRRL